jgi:hypothetical protein
MAGQADNRPELAPPLPEPRGSFSELLFAAMKDPHAPMPQTQPDDEDDLQISLWALYELHYGGFRDVAAILEWSPKLLDRRAALESVFESRLRALTAPLESATCEAGSIVDRLMQIAAFDDGRPSLASHLQRTATVNQFRDFLMQRSIYHLKESDPHAFAVPRLRGRPKVALAELQYDEFGAGVPSRLHSALFADALAAAGLSNAYGEYVDRAYAEVLAVNNAMSLFGLHRRLRGACMGHLAAFEMTSSFPSRRYAMGAERLGFDEPVAAYFDEHVEADAVHEQIAARDICQELARAEPDLIDDIAFGAAACVLLEGEASKVLIDGWDAEDQVAM